jgi:hypothetical protein
VPTEAIWWFPFIHGFQSSLHVWTVIGYQVLLDFIFRSDGFSKYGFGERTFENAGLLKSFT